MTTSIVPARVSVIVRTKNEESWISHCLGMLFRQDYPDFEVIVVDNESTDHTLEAVRRFPVREVVSIGRYLPGLALNLGIRRATGEFIACLSAHCIPQHVTWISTLVAALDDPSLAGAYGRQLPLSFSADLDKRDLLTVFGRDRRIQTRDYFFHNANSILRREVWEKFPFDESLVNIEDRVWGKAVIQAGYRLVYEPEAAVYHHHGINQSDDRKRASGVSMILDMMEQEIASDLPESLKPENCNVVAVAPVMGPPRELQGTDLFAELLTQLKASRYVRSIYALAEHEAVREIASRHGVHFLQRPDSLLGPDKTLEDILKYALLEIEKTGNYPQIILYANYLCPFRPHGLFDELVTEQQYKGLDTVFPGFVDYNDHWVNNGADAFERVTQSLRPRPDQNQPRLYRSLYGLGCAIQAAVVRGGGLFGGKVGILPITEHLHTLRCTDDRPEPWLPPPEETRSPIGWTSEMFLREFRP
ncbi:MAG: glycosyltransferase [Alphaproteobacteria bacterium]